MFEHVTVPMTTWASAVAFPFLKAVPDAQHRCADHQHSDSGNYQNSISHSSVSFWNYQADGLFHRAALVSHSYTLDLPRVM
jgi:hypothetical protein